MDFSIVAVAFYLYLPAGFANMGANLGKFIPIFKNITYPIDFGKKFRGIRIIGHHKNFGSALFGVFLGTSFGVLKYIVLDNYFGSLNIFDFSFFENLLFYFLFSVGALSGDLVKSFIKRQLKVSPHKPFVPFDQIDHVVGGFLLIMLFYPMPLSIFLASVLVFFFAHVLTNIFGYLIGVKEVPY